MKKMKKWMSICLVFAMVLGILASAVPTNATDSINATITAITPHPDKGLIVLEIASDGDALTENLDVDITVGETVNSDLYLHYNAPVVGGSQYLIFAGEQEVGTQVKFGGTATIASGKTVNIPQTALEWTGTMWAKAVAPVDATVGAITQPSRTDNLIVIDITSDEVLPEGTFTGKIKVNGTEEDATLVFNYSNSDYSKNYYFIPSVKDVNTVVTISGVFTGTSGKINIAETAFEYTGTQWEKSVAPVDATVGAITQPSRTDSLIVIDLESDEALPTGTFSGKITVGTTEKTVDLFYNADGGDKNYFFDPGVKDASTPVTISGVFSGSNGKINIAETTFEYTGTQWEKSVPAVDATVGAITQPSRTDTLIVIDLESDTALPTGVFTGKITVGTTEKTVDLVQNVGGGDKNYFFDPGVKDANTLVTISGVFTGTSGKINIAETTFEYTGTQWEKYVAPVDATVTAITQPTRDDNLIVIDITSDEVLPEGTFTGKIKVGETEEDASLVFNYSNNNYSKNYYFIPSVKDANTLVTISGVFTGTNGKINIAETSFAYTGTQWEIGSNVPATDATVSTITQPARTDTLIVIDLTSDAALPRGTFSGKITVGTTEKTVDLVHNPGGGENNYYFDPGVKDADTPVTISGVFTGTNGAINIAETIFTYTGIQWVIELNVTPVDATVGAITQPTRDDSLIVIDLLSDEVLPGEWLDTFNGTIIVGGTEKAVSLTCNVASSDYSKNYYFDPGVKDVNTRVILSGVFVGKDAKINIAKTKFAYTGTSWVIDNETETATFNSLYGQEINDKHIRMLVTTDDTLAENTTLTGTFYVDGGANTSLELRKVGESHYALFTDSITVTEGTKIKLGGIYTTADGRKVDFAEITFVYSGTSWQVDYPAANASCSSLYGQDSGDTHIRMLVKTDDTLAIDTVLTGTFYVDGEENTSLGFMKVGGYHYALFTDSITVTEGTKIKLGGIYKTEDGKKVDFAEVTFVYSGTVWKFDCPIANASCDGLYGQDIADKHIRMLVTTDDTLPIDMILTGTFYVDGEENTSLGFMKSGDYHYALFTDSITVTEGTKIKLSGIYSTADGREVQFADTEFVYNGTVWELVYLGPVPKVDVVQVSFHENTDYKIRINVHGENIVRIMATLTGDIYVNGKVDPKLNLLKYADTYWEINVEEASIGTVVTLGGVYKSAGSAVEFPSIDFVYDGASWGMQRYSDQTLEDDYAEDVNNAIVRYPGVMDDEEETDTPINTNKQEQTDNKQENQENADIQEDTNSTDDTDNTDSTDNTDKTDDEGSDTTVDNVGNDNSMLKIIILASSIGLIAVAAVVGVLILKKDDKKR